MSGVTLYPQVKNDGNVWRAYFQEEEEIQSLQKTISQMEAELDEEQNRLTEASTKLENSEKQLQKVSQ